MKTNYFTLHYRIRKLKPKPKFCENCKKESKLTLANISGKYKENIKDFKWLCYSCHNILDNKIKNLKEYYKKAQRDKFGKFLSKKGTNKLIKKKCAFCLKEFEVTSAFKKYCDLCNCIHNFSHYSNSKLNELRKKVLR